MILRTIAYIIPLIICLGILVSTGCEDDEILPNCCICICEEELCGPYDPTGDIDNCRASCERKCSVNFQCALSRIDYCVD